jgi:hypothetical protein
VEEYPRRRRLTPQEPKSGGGIPIFPLIILVVFAGLLLGGLLAKVFGGGFGGGGSPTPPTATFAPRATPHREASPTPSSSTPPSASPSSSALASAQPSASASPSASPSATPTPRPSVIYITPAPKPSVPAGATTAGPTPTQEPTQEPTQVLITGAATPDHAAAIVRAYLGAVSRGDESTAAGYLAHGLPNESFLTSAAKITDVETSRAGANGFTVTASITTPSGGYYETFTLQTGPYGMQITDHTISKAQ